MNAEEIEGFIARLKAEGNSKVVSIVKVASTYKLEMNAAKKAVHESSAWSAEKLKHNEFQEQLNKALEEDEKRKERRRGN